MRRRVALGWVILGLCRAAFAPVVVFDFPLTKTPVEYPVGPPEENLLLLSLTKETLLEKLVPKEAKLVGETTGTRLTESYVTLRGQGWEAYFYFTGDRVSSATFRDDGPTRGAEKQRFLDLLKDRKLTGTFLRPNAYYATEQRVMEYLKVSRPRTPVTTLQASDLNEFSSTKDGTLLVPDAHKSPAVHKKVQELVASADYDWIALEGLPVHVSQNTLDDYIMDAENSESFRNAKAELERALRLIMPEAAAHHWTLLETLRKRRKRVYALSDAAYTAGRADQLRVATVNLTWASRLPPKGKGLVYVGLAHVAGARANLQDFMAAKRSGKTFLYDTGADAYAAEHIPEVRAAFAKKGVPVDVRIDCESLHQQVKSN